MSGVELYDWNAVEPPTRGAPARVHDETLRDGLQSPSVIDPPVERKAAIVRLLAEVGVESACLGLPGAGDRARREVERLVRTVVDEGLAIRPVVACRTVEADLRPAIDIAQAVGIGLDAMVFLGASPIRKYAEGWDDALLERMTRDAIRMATAHGLRPYFVTEDTVRSTPATLERLFGAALEEGAVGLVLCDTVGHAVPAGVANLVRWTRSFVDRRGRGAITVDWHGHNDRGLALVNAIAAAEAGADRVHGTVLGIGERVGNTPTDQMLVNLRLMGQWSAPLGSLVTLAREVSEGTGTPIPANYPVLGRDAFRTATGVHAAAVIKAARLADEGLADRVYSGVPARWVGRRQEIAIGYMSGASNVRYWLEQHGLEPTEARVRAILSRAKGADRVLSEEDLRAIVEGGG